MTKVMASLSRADSIIRAFTNAFDSTHAAQESVKAAALDAARYISSCGQTAIDELEKASTDKLSKRILPLLSRYACAAYSLEFTGSGTARLIALRDVDAEKKADSWQALPVFHCDYLEKGFKPVFRVPAKLWTWQECQAEFISILNKRGLAGYAAKLESLDIDNI